MQKNAKKLKWSWIDFVVITVVIAFIFLLVSRVDSVLRYDWNWSRVTPFLAYYDEETGKWVANLLLQGLFITIRLAVAGIVLATIIGVVMGLCRTSSNLFFAYGGKNLCRIGA